jgi:hypothetical protein
MNNVKIASAVNGLAQANTVAYNERRRKLLVNNKATTVGDYTIGSSGTLKIAGSTTVVISDYIGAATGTGDVELVELIG